MVHLHQFVKATFSNMMVMVRLRIMPRKWLIDAVPPYPEAPEYKDPEDCDHTRVRRYGNAHGRYARCLGCNRRYKWNPDLQKWLVDFKNSSASSPLPAPSSANTISQAERAARNSQRTSSLTHQSKAYPARPPSRTSLTGPPRPSDSEPTWEPAHWGPPEHEQMTDYFNLEQEDGQDLDSIYQWDGAED